MPAGASLPILTTGVLPIVCRMLAYFGISSLHHPPERRSGRDFSQKTPVRRSGSHADLAREGVGVEVRAVEAEGLFVPVLRLEIDVVFEIQVCVVEVFRLHGRLSLLACYEPILLSALLPHRVALPVRYDYLGMHILGKPVVR